MKRSRPKGESGQTLTEYLMILGVLTASMLSISALVRPLIAWMVSEVTTHEAVHLTSPPKEG